MILTITRLDTLSVNYYGVWVNVPLNHNFLAIDKDLRLCSYTHRPLRGSEFWCISTEHENSACLGVVTLDKMPLSPNWWKSTCQEIKHEVIEHE